MAVKDTYNSDKNTLTLDIDNGDLKLIKEVMEKWKFKNYQSFVRYTLSVMKIADENSLAIKENGEYEVYAPKEDLVTGSQTS